MLARVYICVMSTQEHLDLINAVIANRATGAAVEEYQEASERMRNTPLGELYRIRKMLLDELNADGSAGTSFSYGVMDRGGI